VRDNVTAAKTKRLPSSLTPFRATTNGNLRVCAGVGRVTDALLASAMETFRQQKSPTNQQQKVAVCRTRKHYNRYLSQWLDIAYWDR